VKFLPEILFVRSRIIVVVAGIVPPKINRTGGDSEI
jgi:hypothetical protein